MQRQRELHTLYFNVSTDLIGGAIDRLVGRRNKPSVGVPSNQKPNISRPKKAMLISLAKDSASLGDLKAAPQAVGRLFVGEKLA